MAHPVAKKQIGRYAEDQGGEQTKAQISDERDAETGLDCFWKAGGGKGPQADGEAQDQGRAERREKESQDHARDRIAPQLHNPTQP